MKRNLVVLSGAGISAESGIATFRGEGGLWEGHDVRDVATPEAWQRNPELVLEFYNQRRRRIAEVEPNEAHHVLAELESDHRVRVITQNIDDLHEKAGSTEVLHLHGEITTACSSYDKSGVVHIGYNDLRIGEIGDDGAQLRPNIVWFGEDVPMIYEAAEWVAGADVLVVVGTSLEVYPAASLIHYARAAAMIYVVDPADLSGKLRLGDRAIQIRDVASKGLRRLQSLL